MLNALGKTGKATAPVFVPTPNHDHVIDNSRVNTNPIWWKVRPLLIVDQSDWHGSGDITSPNGNGRRRSRRSSHRRWP